MTRQRLTVTESVYRTRTERFWLDVLDGRVDWRRLFETRALSVAATRWPGSALERLVHHPVLWVLELAPSRAPA